MSVLNIVWHVLFCRVILIYNYFKAYFTLFIFFILPVLLAGTDPLRYSEGFSKAFQRYCKNASLNSLKYITHKNRNNFERMFWFSCNVMLLAITSLLISNMWYKFLQTPTVTSLEKNNYPVEEVNFPGVAICDINKISLRKAKQYSNWLSLKTNISSEILLENFVLLGHLMDFEVTNMNTVLRFQGLLDKMDKKFAEHFHPRVIIRKLSISCEELIYSCKWGSENIDCSKIFQLRLTYDGYCCAFNYVKQYAGFSKELLQKKPLKQKSGHIFGLNVIINNHPEDYFLTTLSTMGVRVFVFSPKEYPDKDSGSLYDIIAPMESETYVEVTSSIVRAEESIKAYSLDKRKCIFAYENKTQLGDYSQSDCFVECKVRSMMSLCECGPFMMPQVTTQDVCTLNDLQCLSKYRDKWTTYAPTDIAGKTLLKEIQHGLRCPSICYPACEYVQYAVSVTSVPLDSKIYNNHTVLHIYQKDPLVRVYKQDVLYYWYEIISNFGGIFGIMVGLSFISIIEFITYFTYKFYLYSTLHH